MPKSQKDTRGKLGLPGRLCGDDFVHQEEEPFWIVLDLDVNVELDVLVLGLHQQLHRLRKSGDGLFGLLDGPNVLHPRISIPSPLLDLTC